MGIKKAIREILEVIVPAILLFLVIRAFLVEARYVPSPSMQPTIMKWDRFMVEKVSYRFHKPRRGDIVVFHPPEQAVDMAKREALQRGEKLNGLDDFIKRIIGLPGEVVEIREGVVYINGEALEEPYITPERRPIYLYGPVKVPEGEYLLLGDNRNQSWDGHVWGFLPAKNIVGKACWRFWPLNRMGIIR